MGVTTQWIGRPVDGQLIGQWVKAATIRAAESALREEVAKGFDNQPIVVTDRMPRRDYNQVKPFGRIEFHRRAQLADVVLWTLDELRKISPVLTGFYVSSHEPLLNGKPIGGNIREALLKMQRGDMVMIVNSAIYAGKIEGRDAYSRWETRGGKRSRRNKRKAQGWTAAEMRGQSGDAKGGVYKKVLFKIKAKYGNLVAADFRPQQLPGGVMVRSKPGSRGKPKAQAYPTMILRLFDS